MKLFNRDSIAREIELKVFKGKTVWELIFSNTIEGIRFVSGSNRYSNKRLFEKMESNVNRKINILGGQLKDTYIVVKGRRKFIDYKNSEELMGKVMSKHLPVIFKIMIRNKYYEFKVEH